MLFTKLNNIKFHIFFLWNIKTMLIFIYTIYNDMHFKYKNYMYWPWTSSTCNFNNDITQINIYIKRLQNYLNLCWIKVLYSIYLNFKIH